MILTQLDGTVPFYRAHSPKWASQPLSGAGAASKGGRLNRPRVHALYLLMTSDVAIAEYRQMEPLMPPCTLAAYMVKLGCVVDFRSGYVARTWHPLWQEIGTNWRKSAFLEDAEPATWSLSDMVLSAEAAGILYPSQQSAGTNLVIYLDALRSTDSVDVFDPAGQLPVDTSSWNQ